MPWRKFFVFNAAGGITWSILYGVLAFELGKNLSLLDKIVKTVGYVGLGGAVVAAVVLFVLYRRRRSKAGTSPPSSSDALESASPVVNDSVSAGERADPR